jgi:hypothetical protein
VSTLQEQLTAVCAGDYVTARFKGSGMGEHIVSGFCYRTEGCLKVGHDWLTSFPDGPGPHLVAIESHEPAKPPVPPEPPIDSVLLDRSDLLWRKRSANDGEAYWTNIQGDALGAWLWSNPGMHRHGPFIIYRPEPSSERIEELAQEFAQQLMQGGPWVSQTSQLNNAQGFARRLLGGES